MNSEREEAMRDFLARAGWADAKLSPLPGDASTRRYLRANGGARKAMLMDQPQGAETPACPPGATPDERRALGYNAVARLAGADCARFVAVAGFLRRQGLSAPDIFAADTRQGFVLMEDLGNDLYADVLADGADEIELYRAAIDALASIHTQSAPQSLAPGKALYPYDDVAMSAETDLMTEWYLPLALGRPARDDETEEHRALWEKALAALQSLSPVFVHRDYHAQNLIWLPERRGNARVGVIDFQDAVAGARGYDIISLMEDARRDVAPELSEAMTDHYLAAMAKAGNPLDGDAHRAEMALLAAQRNAKIVGIFARLYKRDGKPRYLDYLPRVWKYLDRDLRHPSLAQLKAWYDKKLPAETRQIAESVN
ncbi:MAG TPA: phosphotransferase [Rhizomicrobium sp.]|nr:phosphotransferase [Rhizomicrobium sp.]